MSRTVTPPLWWTILLNHEPKHALLPLSCFFSGIVSQVRKYSLHGLPHWEWIGSSIQGATIEDVCNLHSLSPPTLLHTSMWALFPVSSQGVMRPLTGHVKNLEGSWRFSSVFLCLYRINQNVLFFYLPNVSQAHFLPSILFTIILGCLEGIAIVTTHVLVQITKYRNVSLNDSPANNGSYILCWSNGIIIDLKFFLCLSNALAIVAS